MPRALATLGDRGSRPRGPGRPSRARCRAPAVWSVWTESITQTSGRSARERGEDGVEVGLGEDRHLERARRRAARRRRRIWAGGLLAGDVERAPARGGEVAEGHVRERRLADAGRAAEQDERAGDEAAAEHAVELADAGARAAACARRGRRAAGPPSRPSPRPARRRRPPGRRARRPRPAPARAPRRACSTRRSPGSARATSGSARRRPNS